MAPPTIKDYKVLSGHNAAVWSISFAPDNEHLASGSLDTKVKVWKFKGDEPAQEFQEGHTEAVNSVSYSPDNNHVASGSDDKKIKIWDIRSKKTTPDTRRAF